MHGLKLERGSRPQFYASLAQEKAILQTKHMEGWNRIHNFPQLGIIAKRPNHRLREYFMLLQEISRPLARGKGPEGGRVTKQSRQPSTPIINHSQLFEFSTLHINIAKVHFIILSKSKGCNSYISYRKKKMFFYI